MKCRRRPEKGDATTAEDTDENLTCWFVDIGYRRRTKGSTVRRGDVGQFNSSSR